MAAEAIPALNRARAASTRLAWSEARESYELASRLAPLGAEDLERMAVAAFMLGRVDDFVTTLERAHRGHLDAGDGLRAARCAFWIGMNMAFRGEAAPAAGWFARAKRLVAREGRECAEQGYLMLPDVIRSRAAGNYEAASAAAASAAEVGERFGDADLFALSVQAQGLALLAQGRVQDGLGLLDEAMVTVATGELSPIVTGVVYCAVIGGCEEVYEVRRAREWTDALARWCDGQPEMVAFTGRCLAHRAEIMQIHGAWSDALAEARRAHDRCERAMDRGDAGQALYQLGEVHRLRGELAAAEAAYLEANECGREPQPGLALLRLLQGDAAAAGSAIARAVGETIDPLRRTRLLPAYAEIMLASGRIDDARDAADELSRIVAGYDSTMLRAIDARVRGSVALAEGDPQTALILLRKALAEWRELQAPYEVARTRALLGLACRALHDEGTAALELAAARAAFEVLGAGPDLDRMVTADPGARPSDAYSLTPREIEVLRLLAAGKSNRQIASELVLSEHTIARHVQNIRGKLGVRSRTAAAAFAFEHDLL